MISLPDRYPWSGVAARWGDKVLEPDSNMLCSLDKYICKFIQIYWNILTNTCYSSGAGTMELVIQNVGPDKLVALSTLCCSSHPFQSVILSSLSPNCLLSWEKGRPNVFKMLWMKNSNLLRKWRYHVQVLCSFVVQKFHLMKGWVGLNKRYDLFSSVNVRFSQHLYHLFDCCICLFIGWVALTNDHVVVIWREWCGPVAWAEWKFQNMPVGPIEVRCTL